MARSRKKTRLLIIDYSGNPTHYGHLRCGKWMVSQGHFDHVLYAVSGTPATKRKTDVLDGKVRYELAVAATGGDREMSATGVNLNVDAMSWALTAVEGIQAIYPHAEISFGISGEYLDPDHRWWLKKWVGGADLFKRCVAVVFPRGDQTIEQLRQWAKLVPEAQIEVFDAPGLPVSGTQIRKLVEQGRSIRYLAPDAVTELIHSQNHFRLPNTPRVQPFYPLAAVHNVGVFFAAFDPITISDLRRAEVARESFRLDRVEFAPIPDCTELLPTVAPEHLRFDMTLAATANNPYFNATRFDFQRDVLCYPLFAVLETRKKYTDAKCSVLINADWLDPSHSFWLGHWFCLTALFPICNFVVLPTPGVDQGQAKEWAKLLPGAVIEFSEWTCDTVTDEHVRKWVAQRLPITYSTPEAVENIIFKNGLYRPKSYRGRVPLPLKRRQGKEE